MSERREFPKAVSREIIRRATRNGVIHCEGCGQIAFKFAIDHIIPDALTVDKSKRLTAAEGQLLCAGSRETCHGRKTAEQDVPAITRAVRIEAKHIGADRPEGKIQSRGFTPPDKPKRPPRAPVAGATGIARRFLTQTKG